MSEKFVFSTKEVGEKCLFSFDKILPPKDVLNEIRKQYINEDFIKKVGDELSLYNLELKAEIRNRCAKEKQSKLDDEDWEKRVCKDPDLLRIFLGIVKGKKDIIANGINTIDETLNHFCYYTVDEDVTSNVYAVRCCWKPSVDWVNALINDAISDVSSGQDNDNTLYLLLHDKDVPGFDGQSFHILTPVEIYDIGIIGVDEGCFIKGWKIKILVFNHVTGGNAVIKLLEKDKGSLTSAELASNVKAIFNNNIDEFFDNSLEPDKNNNKFKNLAPDSFVDLSNRVLPEIEVREDAEEKSIGTLYSCSLYADRYYYEYIDNGALLTELLHVRTDAHASKQFVEFAKQLKDKAGFNDVFKESDRLIKVFPLIIRLYTSFFDDWAKAVPSDEEKNKILNHPNKKALEKNLKQVFSFFNNSSIWIRIVDINDKTAYNAAVAEFNYFNKIGLYDYKSAREILEYNLRIFSNNYLRSESDGHGNYVTPILYGDERKSLDILVSNNQTLDNSTQQTTGSNNNQGLDNNKKCKKFCDIISSFREWFKDLFTEKPGDSTNSQEKKGGRDAGQQAPSENPQALLNEKEELEEMFKHMKHFHDITFRALLIDDKVCGEDKKEGYIKLSDFNKDDQDKKSIKVVSCDEKEKKCKDCDSNPQCKLKTIKQLMDAGGDGISKNTIFNGIGKTKDFFYWKESGIKTYYCPTIIEDFIDNDDNTLDFPKYSDIKVYSDSEQKLSNKPNDEENKPKTLEVECHFEPKIKKNDLHVQIVGVRDVRTALLLLSKYKFDMVFSDYLLDYKDSNRNEREYANQLFTFLAHDYKKELKGGEKTAKWEVLDKLRHDVLDNRGPLGQMWIMPITGFNQTFIQDIYRDGTNLIDYKWNISNGADPITTPWQFLYHLNKFIELQLCLSVFRMKQLLQFLKYTCEDLEDLNKAQNDELCFDDFKSFMGSEYATFIQLYGNKLPIKRDALIKGGADNYSDSKSVFATYVWNKFYSSKETYNSVELCRLMHRFYFLASYMYNDRVGVQRLNEAFANLLFFVKTNRSVEAVIKENEGKLGGLREKLAVLRESISKCTNNQQEKNN